MNQPKASAHLDCADAFYYDKRIGQRRICQISFIAIESDWAMKAYKLRPQTGITSSYETFYSPITAASWLDGDHSFDRLERL